jgi:hypothetical protein
MYDKSLPTVNRLWLSGIWFTATAMLSCSSANSSNEGSNGGIDGRGGSSGGTSQAGSTTGGAALAGGANSAGGMTSRGGAAANAGAPSGGALSTGGMASAGGSNTAGGTSAGGGVGGAPAGASTSTGPCDIYANANTPCVAAHSTVRALYAAYSGALYQLRRASDKTTKDVPVLAAGGFVNISVQDAFCSGTTCTISTIYDQSPSKNDLVKSPPATYLPNGGVEANADDGELTVGGHTAHGIYVTNQSNVAYRNNATKGIAKGDQPEAMYMVVDGKRYSGICCFDYGNAETSGKDDGNGTMEALYWGTDTIWGGQGQGSGPWIAADLENGMFKSDKGGKSAMTPSAKSVLVSYATAMLKGPSGNQFMLKAGDAQSGTVVTMWNGGRPSPGYSPKALEGAIILGTGGDGSNSGTGTFFEGAMTSGNPPDSVDDLIQANIVAAGYGH